MPRKTKKRKTRVTAKDIDPYRPDGLSSYQRKKQIIPGPWSNIETSLKASPVLMQSSGDMSLILGPSLGTYLNANNYTAEKGWYHIIFNVTEPNMSQLIEKHGMDQYLHAVQVALSETKQNNKTKYGDVVLLEVDSDMSQNTDGPQYLSLRAKTNKKSISGFRATRKGRYITIP